MSCASAVNLDRILARFPVQHLTYGFAYGSGVFQQAGRRANDPHTMVDLMLVAQDTESFHRDNLKLNGSDYSWLGRLGPSAVSEVQTRFGANAYFNTGVPVGDGGEATFKYGVIDARHFRRDLQDWTALYVAGRLHKPVVTLISDDGCESPVWSDTVRRNLESALHVALLQLPETFTEMDLYTTLAGLSYSGDFRMIIGEDRNKVANIVVPQLDGFRSLYRPVLESMGEHLVGCSTLRQDVGPDGRMFHLRRLPLNLKRVLCASFNSQSSSSTCPPTSELMDDGSVRAQLDRLQRMLPKNLTDRVRDIWPIGRGTGDACDEEAMLAELSKRDNVGRFVRNGVYKIVFFSSLVQSLKGIPTAGLLKSVIYSYNKLNKMVKSMI